MNKNLIKSLVIVAGVAFLSACNTVADTAHGTAEGMSKDLHAVSNTVAPAHKKTHRKVTTVKTVKTAPATTEATPATAAPAVTTTTTETN